MPGTEPERQRADLVRQLTIAGWLLLGGEVGFILFQFDRVRTVDGTRFATAWSQRIEVLSFLVLPPNLVVLAPAAAVAAIGALLAGRHHRTQWLDMLLQSVAAIAIALIVVGAASIVELGTRAGEVELDSIFLRLGGMALGAGLAALCRIADTGRL